VEFLNTTHLEILHRGNEPTFCSGGRSEVIDITLGSMRLLESIIGWEVSSEPFLSDQTYSVHLTGLGTGATNYESSEHQLGLLQRGPKGSAGEEPWDGHEK